MRWRHERSLSLLCSILSWPSRPAWWPAFLTVSLVMCGVVWCVVHSSVVQSVQLYCLLAGDLPPSLYPPPWKLVRVPPVVDSVPQSAERHTDGPLSSLLQPAHFRWDITLRSLTTCQSVRPGWGFPSLKLASSDGTYLAGRRLDWINSGMRNEGG